MAGKAEFINQAEYARRRGVSREAVRKAVQDGRITLINGKIDPAVADIQWQQNTNPSQQRFGLSATQQDQQQSQPAGDGSATLYNMAAARAKREHFDAQLAEMKALRESAALVDAQQMVLAITSAAAQLRMALERIPDKLAGQIAAAPDQRVVHEILTTEIEQVMHAMADGLQTIIQQPAVTGTVDG